MTNLHGRPTHPIIKLLREERMRRGLSQPQLAKRIGYHFNTIAHAETGRRNPSLSFTYDLATALGFELAVFPSTPKQFICIDCGGKPLCPMLKTSIWLSIYNKNELACWDCCEKRLGRDLSPDDLESCGATKQFNILANRVKEGRWQESSKPTP